MRVFMFPLLIYLFGWVWLAEAGDGLLKLLWGSDGGRRSRDQAALSCAAQARFVARRERQSSARQRKLASAPRPRRS